MDRPMRALFCFVTARPILVLSLVGVTTLAAGVLALGLTRDTSPDAFIPPGHPALLLKEQVEREFGLVEPIAVGVIRNGEGGIFTAHSLALIERLTRAIQKLPQVQSEDVLSLATEYGVRFSGDEPGFEPLMKAVPQTPAEIEALKRDVFSYELYRGTLVAADGSAACILIRPKSERQADEVYRSLQDLVANFPTQDERLVVAGEAAVRAHMGRAVSDDALRMNFVCPVAMALLIALAYRTGRGTLLPLGVVGGASLWALGSMAACGVPAYIVTNGIFVVIMAVGVTDSIHLMGQYYEEQQRAAGRTRKELIVDAWMVLWLPVLITSVTDFAGFFSLYLSGNMRPIEYFGLFTSVGVVGALVFSYTLVPAGLAVLPLKDCPAIAATHNPGPESLDVIGKTIGRIGEFCFRRWGLVLTLGTIGTTIGVWGGTKMIVNESRILSFKDHHPIVLAANELNRRFDGTSHLNIVVTASQPGAMLQPDVLRQIEALDAFSETLPQVGGTHSLAGWVKRAHQIMHKEDKEYYAIPDDPEVTKYYLDVLGAATSPMSRLLREVVDPTYTKTNLTLRMKSSQYIHQRPVIEALQAYLDQHFGSGLLTAQLAGRANLDYHWVQIVSDGHVRSICFTSVPVFIVTALMFRSVVAGLLCALPVAMTIVVNYAIMGFGGIPLGVGTSMFASIAIGSGVNFPIHVLDRLQAEFSRGGADPTAIFRDTFAYTGRALFFAAIVVGVGFSLLCVSEFRTLVHFGLLIGMAMVVAFLTSITLLPAVLAVMKPRFIWCASRSCGASLTKVTATSQPDTAD